MFKFLGIGSDKKNKKPSSVTISESSRPLSGASVSGDLARIQDHVSKLTHKETGVRKSAALALRDLAGNAENKISIAKAGAIRPLVSLLSDSDTEVRQNAAAALCNLAANAENSIVIAQAGAIRPLVSLLSDSDTIVRKNVAAALSNLALNAENTITIVQAGAMGPLVRLLSDTDASVRQHTASVLSKLAFDSPTNQTMIVTAGGIGPLVRLLSDTDASVRQNTASALEQFVGNSPENDIAIVEAGGIASLARLLSDTNSKTISSAILVLLGLLEDSPANKRTLVLANALPKLKRLAGGDSDADAKEMATIIIGWCQSISDSIEMDKKLQAAEQKQREAVQARAAGVNPESLATFLAHGRVNAFTVLPNGWLASASNNIIKLWSVSTGRCEITFDHRDVGVLTVIPDGRLASGTTGCCDGEKLIKIWDIARGTCMLTLTGHSRGINALAILPNGHLASASDDDSIKIWDLTRGVCVATLSGSSNNVLALAVLADGHLASGHWDGSINIWNLTRKTCVSTLTGHRDRVNELILLPNRSLASASHDGMIKLWDPASGTCVRTLSGHEGIVFTLTLLPDGRLASGSHDCTIKLWNKTTGVCVTTLSGHTGWVYALTVLPDGRLVSGSWDESIKFWDVGFRPALVQAAEALPRAAALSAHLKKAAVSAPIHSDPFEGFAAPSSWGATTSNATTDRRSDFSAGFQPSVSDPFAEFDHLFSAPASSQATTNASSDWASGFSAFPPAPPVAASTPSFSDLKISSSLTTIPWHALMIQRKLGQGRFGVVCEALWQGARVAIKQLIGQLTPDLIEEFQREASVHARLRHTNIIALYGVCVEPLKHALVLEFMANGSLFDVLKGPAVLPWSLRLSLALDMVSGLLYLHTQHIIHRDLKSLNILVDVHMCAKIADFGLAKIKLTTATMTQNAGGTPHWMAPELFDDTVNSNATDVYAAGVILWEIAARELPYKGKNASQIMRYVDKGHRETIPAGTPPPFGLLISRCWAQRAEDRPSIDVVARDMRQLQATGHATPPSAGPSSAHASLDSGFAAFSRR